MGSFFFLPGIASEPRRRNSGLVVLASQVLSMIVASEAASAIVQPTSMKHLSRSPSVTKLGAASKQFRSESRSPQTTASASRGAFSRTHIDRSDAAWTAGKELKRRSSSNMIGRAVMNFICMANTIFESQTSPDGCRFDPQEGEAAEKAM